MVVPGLAGDLSKMGFFSWNVPEDTIHADRTFGIIYEIEPQHLASGVPVGLILSRIVDEDRPRLAQRIHAVLLGEEPSLSQYRIFCPSGVTKSIVSMGSCSTDAEGLPSYYAGAVLEATMPVRDVVETPLATHISVALQHARNDNHELAERYLLSALRSVTIAR